MKRSNWILIVLFALSVGTYFLIKYQKDKTEAEVTPEFTEASFLIQENDTVLQNIRIFDNEYRIVEVRRGEDGFWAVTLPSPGAADIALVSAAESQLSALQVVSDLGNVAQLEDFGLVSPIATIKLTYLNGVKHLIEVGNLTPTNSGYYVQLDDNSVYVVSQYGLESALKLVSSPPYQPTPTPSLEAITPVP